MMIDERIEKHSSSVEAFSLAVIKNASQSIVVGVLAIQGAVEEHMLAIKSLGAVAKEIRYVEDFEGVHGIILPGGESTTMSIVGESNGLFIALKAWVQERKPIWGTCAGMILLSDYAIKKADTGQSLVGGLDVYVCRNYFGSQIHSCILDITTPAELSAPSEVTPTSELATYRAVFIRAPAILKVGPNVRVLSKVTAAPHKSAHEEVDKLFADLSIEGPKDEVIVAVRKDYILATAFHPELTNDLRWHRYFLGIIKEYSQSMHS